MPLKSTSGPLLDLPATCSLTFPGQIDQRLQFAEVRVAWNEQGLGIQWEVGGKREPIAGELGKPSACDGLTLWLDTRDTRTIHRATKFCQRFFLLVHNGETPGVPAILQRKISRAVEDAPAANLELIPWRLTSLSDEKKSASKKNSTATMMTTSTGVKDYRMEVFLPAAVLSGFDPDVSSRLGLCYRLRDQERGEQLLAAGNEFPYWEDPSLWFGLRLVR